MAANGEAGRLRLWPAVAAMTCAGLALRIAAARGGLWTDEAWSMIHAQQARDPLGVFLRINHDNNHHLISLWLQAVGVHASPLLSRVPAIVAGAAAIPAAALLLVRRSTAAALAGAALFTISPIMVTYGSEARGYAPMILAALLMLWLAARSLDEQGGRSGPWLITLTVLLGMLSSLTMIAPLALLTAWVYLQERSIAGGRAAFRATLALMGPAILACNAVLVLVFAAAHLSPEGLQVGGYQPFSLHDYTIALSDLAEWTLGPPFPARWIAAAVLIALGAAMAIRPPIWLGPRGRLYGMLILGVPAVIAAERTGNALFARYYLASALGLLLLAAEWIGHAIRRPGVERTIAAAACVLLLGTAAWRDEQTIRLQRGHPDRPVRIIAAEAPAGSSIAIGTERLIAPVEAAAQRLDYPLTESTGCAPARYLIVVRNRASPAGLVHCGRRMRAIAWSETAELSGDAWVLYRGDLQSPGPPVSGPAPRRAKLPPSAERA